MWNDLKPRELAMIYCIKEKKLDKLRGIIDEIERTQFDIYEAACEKVSIRDFADLLQECSKYIEE